MGPAAMWRTRITPYCILRLTWCRSLQWRPVTSPAEFGQVGSGLFNFTARSGTNELHGSAYEYFVNEDLNAGQPLTNSGHGHLVRPKNRQNDYGFTIGGPWYISKLYDGRNKT